MLYSLHELQRSILDPLSTIAGELSARLRDDDSVLGGLLRAQAAAVHRVTKRYPKPAFGVGVEERVVWTTPFMRLLHFAGPVAPPIAPPTGRHADALDARGEALDLEVALVDVAASAAPVDATPQRAAPRVLVVAPLSGHHATLLRDTIATLLRDHDVYVTDWLDARDVPVAAGPFGLADYVALVQRSIRDLGGARVHVVAVCQPTVPVLAAVSLLAAAGEPTPASMTLMGGPVDAQRSPTSVNRFAMDHSLAWFEANMIHRVPRGYAGAGRAVYPGFLQLTAFVAMNPLRHAAAYQRYWFSQAHGARDAESALLHERFYDEYNAVLDMDAAYYLDTVRLVFQEFALARGTWRIGDQRVAPAAITGTALLTVEGALDDISGLGQTAAAHDLCSGIAASHKHHVVAEGCGHYGIFSGRRWREDIYPQVRTFIRAAEDRTS